MSLTETQSHSLLREIGKMEKASVEHWRRGSRKEGGREGETSKKWGKEKGRRGELWREAGSGGG